MKNGRSLRGHCRTLTRTLLREWQSGCDCGWCGEIHKLREAACIEYRAHLDHAIDHGNVECQKCGNSFPVSQMRPGSRHICKGCNYQKERDWQAANLEASRTHKRQHHLKKKFSITIEQADALLSSQGGVCAICRKAITDKRGYGFHVDHNHATRKVRGILCFHCNSGLGLFKDNIEVLKSAVEYLKRHDVPDEVVAEQMRQIGGGK